MIQILMSIVLTKTILELQYNLNNMQSRKQILQTYEKNVFLQIVHQALQIENMLRQPVN